MAYVKTNWVANETPISPGNMNKIEQGIYDAQEAAAVAAIGGSQALTDHEAESATTAVKGHVQLATNAEVTTGTNTAKAVTPAGAKVEFDKKIDKSMATSADQVMVSTGIGAWAVKTLAQFRTWLGLGDAAYKNTGTAVGTAAAGDHTHGTYVPHSLATAVNDFIVASGAGVFVKKTLGEVKTILGLGTAAYTASTAYATAAQGTKADNALPKAGGTVTGAIDMADYGLLKALMQDYAEKIGTTPATTGTCNFDLTTGNVFTVTPTGAITIGAVNPPASGRGGSATIWLTNGATVYAKAFAATIKWVGDEIPDMSEAGKTYGIVLTILNGGTTYRAACIGAYSA